MDYALSRGTALAAAVVMMIVLTGCPGQPGVLITYEALVNTKQIDAPPNAGSQQSFAVYCISKIENTGSQATTFNFDIDKLHVVNPKQFEQVRSDLAHNWPWSAQNTTVAAGATEYDVGMIFLNINVVGQPDGGMYHAVQLGYEDSGDQVVHVVPHPNPPTPQFVDKILSNPPNLPTCTPGQSIP